MPAEQRSGTTLALCLVSFAATEKMVKKIGEEVGCQGKGLCLPALVAVRGVGQAARRALVPMLSSGDVRGEL